MRIDCHRHLGGSVQPSFVWDVIQQHGWNYLAESPEDVTRQMTFAPGEPYGFHRFLDKFRVLDHIEWTEDLIDRSIQSVCDGLRQDRIDYALLRFSINKYMGGRLKWHRYQAINFIHGCFQHHYRGRVGLVLSLKYESPRTNQQQYARLIEDHTVAESLVGLDLVGDEQYFDGDFYAPIFRQWKGAGKLLFAHVAESQSAHNARVAIEQLGCDDLAHGLKAWEYPDILTLARERDTGFAMALKSNYLTGSWGDPDWHPIRKLFDAGLDVTVGTDDPVQCATSYDEEFALLHKLGFSASECAAVEATAERRCRRYGLLTG